MPNPIIKIVDVSTGEEIERPMTKDEFDSYKIATIRDPKIDEEKAARAAARQAIAERLGLTADELAVLLG